MTVTYEEKTTKIILDKKDQFVPYFAKYFGYVVFVIKKEEKYSEGYMVNASGGYKPFEYFSTEWANHNLTPITNAKIIIDID